MTDFEQGMLTGAIFASRIIAGSLAMPNDIVSDEQKAFLREQLSLVRSACVNRHARWSSIAEREIDVQWPHVGEVIDASVDTPEIGDTV